MNRTQRAGRAFGWFVGRVTVGFVEGIGIASGALFVLWAFKELTT